MKVQKNKIFFFLLLVISSTVQSQTVDIRDYNSYLAYIKNNHVLAKQASNQNEIAKRQLAAARGNYDPKLNSDIQNKYFNSKNYYTVAKAELKQPIYTSQYLKLGYEYGQGTFVGPEDLTSQGGLPFFGIEASLLQGLMFDKRRAEVTKAKFYKDYYEAESKIQLNDLLLDASQNYFEFLFVKRVLGLQNFFYNIAIERQKGIVAMAIQGERAAVDTIESSIFLQGRLMERLGAETEVIKQKNELNVFTYNQETRLPELLNQTDSIDIYYKLATAYLLSNFNRDTLNNPILNQYTAKSGVLETEYRWRREQIKPKLDVSYNFLSTSNQATAPLFNSNNYKWGASLSFPLFLRNPVNESKIAKIDFKNNQFELQNKSNQINAKLGYISQSVALLIDQLNNAEKSVRFSKQLVEAERIKFFNGESSLFILNARETKWFETELKLLEYKMKLINLVLYTIHLRGNLNYELIQR